MLEPRYPLFPLVESGFQRLGGEAVELIADLELGLAQLLAVGLAGHQACEAAGLVEEGLPELFVEALGFGLLLGGKGDVAVHGGPRGGVR